MVAPPSLNLISFELSFTKSFIDLARRRRRVDMELLRKPGHHRLPSSKLGFAPPATYLQIFSPSHGRPSSRLAAF